MSHFSYLETMFQNLFYLKKTLDKENIVCKFKQVTDPNLKTIQTNLIIPQSNNNDIEFNWNNAEYELIVDQEFWTYPYPVETFKNKISKQYAEEIVIGEGQKMGFQPVKNQKNGDGSSTITLERCSTKV